MLIRSTGYLFQLGTCFNWVLVSTGYLFQLGTCSNWVPVSTGYLFQLGTCFNWVSVPTGYLFQLGTCSNWVPVPTGYLFQLGTCFNWVPVSTGYLFQLGTCFNSTGYLFQLGTCSNWVPVSTGYRGTCFNWVPVSTGYLIQLGTYFNWVSVSTGYLFQLGTCVNWYLFQLGTWFILVPVSTGYLFQLGTYFNWVRISTWYLCQLGYLFQLGTCFNWIPVSIGYLFQHTSWTWKTYPSLSSLCQYSKTSPFHPETVICTVYPWNIMFHLNNFEEYAIWIQNNMIKWQLFRTAAIQYNCTVQATVIWTEYTLLILWKIHPILLGSFQARWLIYLCLLFLPRRILLLHRSYCTFCLPPAIFSSCSLSSFSFYLTLSPCPLAPSSCYLFNLFLVLSVSCTLLNHLLPAFYFLLPAQPPSSFTQFPASCSTSFFLFSVFCSLPNFLPPALYFPLPVQPPSSPCSTSFFPLLNLLLPVACSTLLPHALYFLHPVLSSSSCSYFLHPALPSPSCSLYPTSCSSSFFLLSISCSLLNLLPPALYFLHPAQLPSSCSLCISCSCSTFFLLFSISCFLLYLIPLALLFPYINMVELFRLVLL